MVEHGVENATFEIKWFGSVKFTSQLVMAGVLTIPVRKGQL